MDVIVCKNLWKIFNEGTHAEVKALQGIDLKIKKGEFVAIMGSSGSGKSTLLNCISCLDIPTKGKIFIDGKDISKLGENRLAYIRREKIGFVFQTFNLIPSLTAMQNVELPMVFKGTDKTTRIKCAEQLLKEVGLEKRESHKPSELSGGEIQRVAIARALANNPSFIVADEPTGNLDSKSGVEIIKIFKKLNKDGKTIIMVTHDPKIGAWAKRIIKLQDGKIIGS
jgi:putative ABC transport system ATP-binding protein